MSGHQVVSTQDAPVAVGPYSQGVAVDGFLFCSGQVALDPETGELLGGTIAEETQSVMANLGAVLAAGGASFSDVVKVTAYLTDISDFAEFNEAYGSHFGEAPPARATVGVASLPKGARVEVECVARLGA